MTSRFDQKVLADLGHSKTKTGHYSPMAMLTSVFNVTLYFTPLYSYLPVRVETKESVWPSPSGLVSLYVLPYHMQPVFVEAVSEKKPTFPYVAFFVILLFFSGLPQSRLKPP